MPKFIVTLTRDMADSESATAIVEAESEQQSKEIALDKVDRNKLVSTANNDFESETIVDRVELASEADKLSELEDSLTCGYCGEVEFDVDELDECTHQQWRCPACGNWNDRIDEGVDTSDIPEAGEEFFQKAKLVKPQG